MVVPFILLQFDLLESMFTNINPSLLRSSLAISSLFFINVSHVERLK